jgi:CBS-domain-containing membrane protein
MTCRNYTRYSLIWTRRQDGWNVAEAARLMAQNDLSALPVVDDDKRLVGINGEADLLRREELGTEVRRPDGWRP